MSRLLLVEDDPVFARVLGGALERRGHVVEHAASLAQARASIERVVPDGAVLDLKLGDELSLNWLPELHARCPRLPVVLLTGYASIATAVRATRLGATAYLPKPVTVDEVLAALAGAAAAPEPPRPLPLRVLEWEHIQRVLAEHGGNVSAAARSLGLHRRVLQRKLAKRAPFRGGRTEP